MLSKTESLTIRLEDRVKAWKRAVLRACIGLVKAAKDGIRVLKIMVFLHSATDFTSVLRLYGIEGSLTVG
jgi:hypothetical protein